MTRILFLILVLSYRWSALASDYERKPDRTSAAGLLLEEVDLQTDAKQRLALLESFAGKYPRHQSAPWALDQIRAQAIAEGKWERVAEISTQMLEANPDDVWSATSLLEAVEKSGDTARLAKAVETASTVSDSVLRSKTSKDEANKRRHDAARKLAARGEAVHVRLILTEADARKRVALLDGFESRYPKSAMTASVPLAKALAMWTAGDPSANAVAQDAVKKLAESEDAQFVALASSIVQDPGQDNLVPQALWLLEMMQRKTKPGCASDSDWDRKRDLYIRTIHVALGLAAHRRGDRHLAQRSFAAAAAYAEGDHAKALLDSLVQGKGDVVPGAVELALAKSAGFDLQASLSGCLVVKAKE